MEQVMRTETDASSRLSAVVAYAHDTALRTPRGMTTNEWKLLRDGLQNGSIDDRSRTLDRIKSLPMQRGA